MALVSVTFGNEGFFMGKTILLAGGTGLIGMKLSSQLREQQYVVRILTRAPGRPGTFAWNPAKGEIDPAALQGVDYVVNLAGAGIADKRWTAARKRELVDSRVQAARVLAEAFARMDTKPQAYISASAIGYYGNSGEQLLSESTLPVDESFMVDCCRQWEAAADQVADLGIRTVKLRIGVVLAQEGGALAEIARPLRWGLGAYFGDGQAWWSWIHREDVCRIIQWAIEQPNMAGVFNAVAPHPVRGKDLVQAAAKALNQPRLILPAPSIAIRLALGEMSAVVLNSNRVSSKKLEETGFKFLYPEVTEAMHAIFG